MVVRRGHLHLVGSEDLPEAEEQSSEATLAQGVEPEQDAEPEFEGVARAILLRQLTASPKTKKQLADKLRERKVPAEVAEQLLDRFEETGLIDDAAFATWWVTSRIRSKSLASGALRQELAQRGVAAEHIEAALAEVDRDAEAQRGAELIRAKLGRVRDLSFSGDVHERRAARDKMVRRYVGMLARKGYSPGTALGIVNSVLEEFGV